jgi:flavin reductase (DIM6/NTAB) family NADH-FMN oxidoreductase RutF
MVGSSSPAEQVGDLMDISPANMDWQSIYKLMIGSVVPRPIGWVSTIDLEGRPNLAPFSFFTIVCPNPPHVLFCPNIRRTDDKPKDTLNNIRSTGEFVVNIVTKRLAQAMNISATEFPAEVNEFEMSGLTEAASGVVTPPGVAESPIRFECQLAHLVSMGEGVGSGSVVIGRVVHMHVDEAVLLEEDEIDVARLDPIGRLAGASYCRVTDMFEMRRPPSQLD